MKIINKKYLTFIFLAITLCFCSIFCLNFSGSVYAEDFSDVFTVKQHTSLTDPGTTIQDGSVAYITPSDSITAVMESTSTKEIDFINPYITYNGQSINSDVISKYSIDYSHDGMKKLTLTLTFNDADKTAPYGKYDIRINYIVSENGISSNKTLTYVFYALKNSDYYSGTTVNAIYDNCHKVDKSLVMPYDNIYQFNYDSKVLPRLAVNFKNINLTITKTFQKNTSTQRIWFDGTNIQTDNNIVYFYTSEENDFLYVTFNDLGTYTISYNFIYTYNNTVENIEKSAQNANTKYVDLLEMFGYQLYYSDIETSLLKEFKNIDSNGAILEEVTDISYLFSKFNASLNNTQDNTIQNILAKLNNNEIAIQETNQSPVQFKYNVEIFNKDNSNVVDTQSAYYMLELDKETNTYSIINDSRVEYDNSPLTKAGIYLVNVVYKYTPTIIGADEACAPSGISNDSTEKLRSQWFVFEITKSTTKISIETNENENKQALNDGSFTNKDVLIKKDEQSKSIFNAKTKLVVSIQENFAGDYVDTEITSSEGQVFSSNGNYIVTMYFGKNLNRSYSSTFTIDKEEIDNIQIFSVDLQGNNTTYTRNKQIEFMTNQSVVVSWNNKASGSVISAQYKYFPITLDSSYSFSDDICKKYYNKDYSILSNYEINLEDSEYTPVEYSNSQVYTQSIPSSAVLSQNGLYVFKLLDSAGNEKYFAFVIDKTPSIILQQINGTFVDPTELNIVSSDVDIMFGQYKVIKLKNLKQSVPFENNDSWLDKILNTTEIYNSHFKLLQINTFDDVYISIKNNAKVLMCEQESTKFIDNNILNKFSIHIPFEDGKDITFYTQDELCNNGYFTEEEYLKSHSNIFRVKLSSDASQTNLIYKAKDQKNTTLYLSSFNHIDNETSTKNQYYIPTTANTLASSNEILTLEFLPVPESGVLEVESVEYEFTPFSPSKKIDEQNSLNYTYSYVFDNANTVSGIVYSKLDPTKTLAKQNGDKYSWEINLEYNNITGSKQTKSGKYVITRRYAQTSQLNDKLAEKQDYVTRTFTFIIDRNGIITNPVVTDSSSQNMYSYVGEAIKIQVLENENDKMFFNDIYLAKIANDKNSPILQTNKLPVFVYIPVYTYGYAYTNGGTFNLEDSILYYDTNDKLNSLISSYVLSAEIKYSYEQSSLEQSTEIYKGYNDNSDGYLKFNGISSTSGRAFTKVGYYKVTIKQGLPQYGQNEFSYIFSIESGSPDFKVTSMDGTELSKDSLENYYTNNENIKLEWEDPVNKFRAKINKNEIYYSINGSTQIKVNSNQINTSENINTVNINLNDIGAYKDGNTIQFFMQFEGDQKDYQEGSFKKTSTLIIDTKAPDKNLNNLISLSGIDSSLLRTVETKYNTSTVSGLYKYYAFPVDKSQLENVFDFTSYDNGDTYGIYYRVFENNNGENTKYNNIYTQETLPSDFENSKIGFTSINDIDNDLLTNDSLINKYIEIVEVDLAGNITIYTIYLTNLTASSNVTAITYTQNNRDEKQNISYNDLSSNITINAKSAFALDSVNIANFAWSNIKIGDQTFLKTPYSNNVYYDLAKYNPIDISASEITLKKLSTLSASNQKQSITLGFVPLYDTITLTVSVLNTSLNVFHTSETNTYASQEGVLIKIPSTSSVQDATIYAIEVRILEYIREDNTYKQNQLYEKRDETYFASAGQTLVSPAGITTTYVNYLGNTYMKIIASEPKANIFYKYIILDNFGDTTEFTNIYGNEKVDKELNSSVDLVERYEDGVKYYYSTKDIVFKYNSAKDRIILNVGASYDTRSFDLSVEGKIAEFNNSGYGQIILPQKGSNSNIYTIILKAPSKDLANSVFGSEIKFTIKKFIAVEEISQGRSYDTLNLIIYNKVPEFTLLGTSNQNLNELFNKGSMYGNAIKITFKQTNAKILCDVFLLNSDDSLEAISSGKIVSDPNTYKLVVKYTNIFTNQIYDEYFEFTISNNDFEYYKVVYTIDGITYYAQKTGNKYSYQDGNTTYEITNHYIINTKDYDIIYNTEQGYIEDGEPTLYVTNNIETYIHTIKSNNESSKLERKIAVSIIPRSSDILRNFSYYENEGTPAQLTGTEKRFVVTKEENNISGKRISWQSYYGIAENLVNVEITYGDSQTPYTPTLTTENDITSLVLSNSGIYQLVFKDMAGNVHLFETKAFYTINYLKTVIFTINDQSPINNAVYNENVIIKIPSYTTRYYDQTAQPRLHALKNGEEYSPEKDIYEKTFIFADPGLYKIWFSAGVTDSGKTMEINEQPIYFLIINKNESRYAFDYSEYGNYYVKQILKNDVDITEKLTNENMGTVIYKNNKAYLKNFNFSVVDALTGKGKYTVTIATGNEFNQEFTFSFWLNNKTPSIQVSIGENEETTDTIKVLFNTANLIEDVGDCVLKITGQKDLKLNSAALADNKIKSTYEIELTTKGTYFIQLYSESGKLLYSYRVVKNEPLNAVSIIVIVVACIVVVGLTLTFVLLRKKMKIR